MDADVDTASLGLMCYWKKALGSTMKMKGARFIMTRMVL
jgi:hypothetical protein